VGLYLTNYPCVEFVVRKFLKKYNEAITTIHNLCMCECVECVGRAGQEVG
jgi:hypothetical protein